MEVLQRLDSKDIDLVLITFNKNKYYVTKQAPVIGGRAKTQKYSWDGLIGNIRLTNRALAPEETLLTKPAAGPDTLAYWQFNKADFYADSTGNKNRLQAVGAPAQKDPQQVLLTEYCHVLLNANAFLYID